MATNRAIAFVVMGLLCGAGCGGSSETHKPEAPAVGFTVSTQEVNNTTGGKCLQFTAVPDADIVLIGVTITNPVGYQFQINAGSTTIVAHQSFPLQYSTECYASRTGLWTFQFRGTSYGTPFEASTSYTKP